ncbi:MAG TPA: hypothetical protein DHV12_03075, partial [Thermotogae bacterium]|nr:hypothetical protein [Thermotogota bacterium]
EISEAQLRKLHTGTLPVFFLEAIVCECLREGKHGTTAKTSYWNILFPFFVWCFVDTSEKMVNVNSRVTTYILIFWHHSLLNAEIKTAPLKTVKYRDMYFYIYQTLSGLN